MATVTKMLAAYAINGKRKPVATGLEIDSSKPLPSTIEYNGATYHFSNADLVAGTVTYVNVPLGWQ